jgi:shikimate dehydrogenase
VDVATEAVTVTGACNTFWCEDGVVHGDNTDVYGFVRAVEQLIGREGIAGARVVLCGAGGAARGAMYALLREHADQVVIVNRSRERAEELRGRFVDSSDRIRIASATELRGERFDLVVNATALGLSPDDPLPLPLEGGPSFTAALDMVYAPSRTPWVNALRDRGINAEDGLEMLLQQGAAAFERWWGFPPSLVAMRDVMPLR